MSRSANFTLVRWALVLQVLVLLGIGFALYRSLDDERDLRAQVYLTSGILADLRNGLRAGIDAETSKRGYLLTNDPDYLQLYDEGITTWPRYIDSLEERLGARATKGQSEAISRLRDLSEARIRELDRSVGLARAGESDAAVRQDTIDEGKALMDRYRAEVSALEQYEERLLAGTLREASQAERQTFLIFIALGFLLVLLVGALIFLERRAARADRAILLHEAEKERREQAELLSRELNHRVQNVFTVILSLVSFAGRGKSSIEETIEDLKSRIFALSSAHKISQGRIDSDRADLASIINAVLQPYRGEGNDERISLKGPPITLPHDAVTPLGLILHELATNATKYGALQDDHGRVRIRWFRQSETVGAEGKNGGDLVLEWKEVTGTSYPTQDNFSKAGSGFGQRMMTGAAQQMGGKLEWALEPTGVLARIIIDKA